MSSFSNHRRWGRTAGRGWGFEDPSRMDIRLNEKFSVCGGGEGLTVSSSHSKDCDSSCSVRLRNGRSALPVSLPPLTDRPTFSAADPSRHFG